MAAPHQALKAAAESPNDWKPALLESLRNCGVPTPPIDRRGKFKTIVVMFLLLVLAAAGPAIPDALSENNVKAPYTYIVWGAYVIVFVSVLKNVRLGLLKKSTQMGSKTAIEAIEGSERRPVFYLRSFQQDEHFEKEAAKKNQANALVFETAEREFTRILAKLGPVLAIGRPGEQAPAIGAARFYASEQLWQQKVADVAQASQLVVWSVGVTQGAQWELSYAVRNLPPEKLVLWAQPWATSLQSSKGEGEAEWKQFREATSGLFPKPLPEFIGDTRLICFAADWQPIRLDPARRNLWWRGNYAAQPSAISARAIVKVRQGKIDLASFTAPAEPVEPRAAATQI